MKIRMPYKLRKAPKRDLYWVVGEDGTHKSKDPLPKEKAEAQMRALYAAMDTHTLKGGGETYTKEGKRIEAKLMRSGIDSLTKKEREYLADEMIHANPEDSTPATIARSAREATAAFNTRPATGLTHEVSRKKDSVFDRLSRGHTRYNRHGRGYEGKGMFGPDDDGPTFVKGDPLPMKNGSVDMNAFNQNIVNNIQSAAKATKDEQARQFQEKKDDLMKQTWSIGGDVVNSFSGLLGMIPGVGQYIKPIAGVAGDVLHSLGSGRRRKRVSISRKNFIKEHKNLLRVLKSGKKSKLRAEARDQAKELKKVLRGGAGVLQAITRKHAEGWSWEIREDDVLIKQSDRIYPTEAAALGSVEIALEKLMGERHHVAYEPTPSRRGKRFYKKEGRVVAELRKVIDPAIARGEDVWEHDGSIPTDTMLSENILSEIPTRKDMTILPKKPRRGRGRLPAKLTKLLKGAGIFDSIYNWGKSAYHSVKKTLGIEVRNDFSPSVRKLLQEKGNIPIVMIVARRDPIQSMINTALNAVSFGQWNKARKDVAYDKLFHLGLEVSLKRSSSSPSIQRLIIEKNAVIEIHPPKATTELTEVCNIPLSSPTTLNTLLEGAKNVLGGNMFIYDAFNNNCQDFVMALLKGSGLATPEAVAFVKQPLEALVANLPSSTSVIARGVTDLGAVVDRITQGAGKGSKFEAQLRKAGIEPSSYLKEAQRRAKDAGLPYKVLGFADDGKHKLAIPDADGRMVKFGKVGYGDHLIWSHLESEKKVPMGTADAKRKTFHKSHSAIRGDWKKNPFSPNNLALKVIW